MIFKGRNKIIPQLRKVESNQPKSAFVTSYGKPCGIAYFTLYNLLPMMYNGDDYFGVVSISPDGSLNENPEVKGVIDFSKLELEMIRASAARLVGADPNISERQLKKRIAEKRVNKWVQYEKGLYQPHENFLQYLEYLEFLGVNRIFSHHSMHFQQDTYSGMKPDIERDLSDIIEHVSKIYTLSEGAYGAGVKAFPEHSDKFGVLRHGVHDYSSLFTYLGSKQAIRNTFLNCLQHMRLDEDETRNQKLHERIELAQKDLKNGARFFGGFGYPNEDKTHYIPWLINGLNEHYDFKIIGFYMGCQHPNTIGQPVADELIQKLKNASDKSNNFIYIDRELPEMLLGYGVASFDVAILAEMGGSQSGRLVHVLGASPRRSKDLRLDDLLKWLMRCKPTLILAWDREGNAETLRKAYENYPLAKCTGNFDVDKYELLNTAKNLIDILKNDQRIFEFVPIWRGTREYVGAFNFDHQANKHKRCVVDPYFEADMSQKRVLPELERISHTTPRLTGTNGKLIQHQLVG